MDYWPLFVTSASGTRWSAGTGSPRSTFAALSTAMRPMSRHRCLHRARVDCLPRIVQRVEADDADAARPPGGCNCLDGAERHQIAAGEQGVDVRVRLQHVLKNGEALVAFPVGGLTRHDGHPGMRLNGIAEAAQAGIARLVAGNAFEDGDTRLPAGRPGKVIASHPTAFVIVRSDERFELQLVIGDRLGIDPRIDDDHRHGGAIRLHDRGRDLARSAGRDDQDLDACLKQVLDDLHLFLDVDLALGGLHDELDAGAAGRLLRATLHVEEERMVERLHDEGDARRRLLRGWSAAIASRGNSRRHQCQQCEAHEP
jgi:hypothetical protein